MYSYRQRYASSQWSKCCALARRLVSPQHFWPLWWRVLLSIRVHTTLYWIHCEISGYPCNVIGSQQGDLFTYRAIFCCKSHLFPGEWHWGSKTKQPIRFQGFYKLTNHTAGKWKTKSHCLANLAIKLCDFKIDLIKRQLNLGSCNFGLKSYFWCTRTISDQIALHSVQFPRRQNTKNPVPRLSLLSDLTETLATQATFDLFFFLPQYHCGQGQTTQSDCEISCKCDKKIKTKKRIFGQFEKSG